MHYCDPNRPKASNAPAYITPDGRPIAALPQPSIRPLPDGHFVVSMWLRIGSDYQCQEHFHWCEDAAAVIELINAFAGDPETTMRNEFAYQGIRLKPVAKPTPPKRQLNLSDLGL